MKAHPARKNALRAGAASPAGLCKAECQVVAPDRTYAPTGPDLRRDAPDVGSFPVKKRCFDTLVLGGQLSSSVIDAVAARLNEQELTYVRPRMLLLPTNFGQTIKDRYAVRYVGLILLANDMHWVLYIADYDHRDASFNTTLYDSLGSHTERDRDAERIFAGLFHGRTYAPAEPPRVVASPQQTNSFDCGVFALANAFYFAENPQAAFSSEPPAPYAPARVAEFRQTIARWLLEASSES